MLFVFIFSVQHVTHGLQVTESVASVGEKVTALNIFVPCIYHHELRLRVGVSVGPFLGSLEEGCEGFRSMVPTGDFLGALIEETWCAVPTHGNSRKYRQFKLLFPFLSQADAVHSVLYIVCIESSHIIERE